MTPDVLQYLKYGVIGLCGVLTFLAYLLLAKEQGAPRPRNGILKAIKSFMAFAVVTMLIGATSQAWLKTASSGQSNGLLESGFGKDFFAAQWKLVDSHDVDFEHFKARYSYTGVLGGRVEDGDLILEGELSSHDIKTNVVLGVAHFVARGPISNNQVAAHYTYTRRDVNGFGTAFMEFDGAGYGMLDLVFRITHVLPEEGDIGAAKLQISRVK